MARDNEQLNKFMFEVSEKLGRIEAGVQNLKDDIVEIKAQTQRTNGRVNVLEAFKENMQGRIAVIALFAGFVGTLIVAWFKKQLDL